MSQLSYWIRIDEIQVGGISYSLQRISNQVDGIQPMIYLNLHGSGYILQFRNETMEIEMVKVIHYLLRVVQWLNQ